MLVVSGLNDGATRDFLNAASGGTISYHGQIDHLLRDVARRAEEAISWLVTKDGKTKAGRNKAEPPGYFSPQDLLRRFNSRGMEVHPWLRARPEKSEGRGGSRAILERVHRARQH